MENAIGKQMGGLGSMLNGLKSNVFSYPIKIEQQHNMYITGPIREVEEHMDRIETIRTAQAGDVIRIIINTPGGHVDTMISYMQAIKESKARVICHAEGSVASAGTFIWLSGHEHSVADYTAFMFHNMQYGTYGDAANIERAVNFNTGWGRELMSGVYKGFLSDEEFKIIENAGEVYLSATQVKERMGKYYEYRDSLKEKEPCQCEECLALDEFTKQAHELGYFSITLISGKTFNVPIDGNIPEDLLEQYDIAEWRDLAVQLQVEIKKNDSRKKIREKIVSSLLKGIEEEDKTK